MTGADWPFGDLHRRHYGAILADPPWQFRTYTPLDADNWAVRRDAAKHYAVMGLDQIAALPVADLAAENAHLFLWTTGPHLRQAFDVIDAWGFRYSGIGFTWVKLKRSLNLQELHLTGLTEALHVGLGHTTRKNSEICLLARRGSPRRNARDVREIVLSPVREHSRKPDEIVERIERYCDGPYAELFARSMRPGWDCWGVEISRFASRITAPSVRSSSHRDRTFLQVHAPAEGRSNTTQSKGDRHE